MQAAVERRPTLFFLVVLAALFALMAASTRTRVGGETRTMFERSVMWFFSPIPRSVHFIGQNTSDMYHGYLDVRRAISQNRTLSRKVSQLTEENLLLRKSHVELSRMRAILGYSEQLSTRTQLAQVVMLDTQGRFKSAIIDRGSDVGIEVNDVVVNTTGLIGRVVLTTKDLSKIQLIIDGNSSVGSMLERGRRQGVVRGDGHLGARMDFVPALTDVVQGDRIVTGGIDGIYPRGVQVGTVAKVEDGKNLFKTIYLRPVVDFANLEEVIVLHSNKIPRQVAGYIP
ncbi:MAG TPA: rod shape-determining protein MreC [Thermoanaerobaculia bacterium]|nr:rod shape-determining protein MreC [Thermoanaerobaculia bacterium]